MSFTISQSVPVQPGATQYVRTTYPLILEFLECYYQWAELDGNPNQRIGVIGEQRNIDKTLDQFLKYFQYELLNEIPTNILADKRLLAKHIKDFYLARGSENSYRLLFRILYDEDVEFYYPKVDIFKSSDGKWSVDTVIRTTTTTDTSKFIGRQLKGLTSGTVVSVENVIVFNVASDVVSEIYITSINGPDFEIGETIEVILPDNTVAHETVYGIVTGATIINPGTGYKAEDIITITSNSSGVLAVNVTSGIERGRVVAAGFANTPLPATLKLASTASTIDGYYENMILTITDGSGNGQIRKVISYSGSSQVATLDLDWITLPDITSHYSIELGMIKSVKVQDFGINYSSSLAADFIISGNGNASGNITFGTIGRYAGRFVNTDGFLDNNKYLQDSFYYQDFSYVLKAINTINEYGTIVKQILHPASLIMFGDVIVQGTTNGRKHHTASSVITTSDFSGAFPTDGLTVQYAMLQDLVDVQKVFDVSSAFPTGYNALMGSFGTTDFGDPSFNSSGVQFRNNFVNATYAPLNNTEQTIIAVFSPLNLSVNGSILGSIDTSNDTGVSGYQIIANLDGSITFRAQKFNGSQHDLRISYPSASISVNNYYFASLRYLNNTVVGNLNQLPLIQSSFGTLVDGSGVINNSRGLYLGVGGYYRPDVVTDLGKTGLYGSTLPGIPKTYIPPFADKNGFFDGIISYVIVYNRYLSDDEISDTYQFLKQTLETRSIFLP